MLTEGLVVADDGGDVAVEAVTQADGRDDRVAFTGNVERVDRFGQQREHTYATLAAGSGTGGPKTPGSIEFLRIPYPTVIAPNDQIARCTPSQ